MNPIRIGIARSPAKCPKCGDDHFAGPEYHIIKQSQRQPRDVILDCLIWKCDTCGYPIDTPCLDAEKETK